MIRETRLLPEDLVGAALFLASSLSDFMTGHSLVRPSRLETRDPQDFETIQKQSSDEC